MSQDNPIIRRYLENLEAGLPELAPADRDEVIRDIRSHISEAVDSGKPLDQVLTALGSSQGLARAYSVELLMKRPDALKAGRSRALRLAGLIIFGSIPTIVVVIALGVVGIAFTLVGILLFFAGQAALADTLPWWITMDADPRLAMVVGPLLSVLGLVCLGGLWLYARLAAQVVRRVLPPRSA